ncbi:MAG: signal peptide peptidase SppA [Bacteroidales bacterium]|jgi:protease-4|nr:signal peptide peptidase SppA [Bacteroidales bacterium]
MSQFLKFTLATVVGVFIAGIISFFLFLGIIGAIVSSAEDKEVIAKGHSILHLNLDYPISDRGNNDPFAQMSFLDFSVKVYPGLDEIIRAINKAKDDPNIDGIYIASSTVLSGMSSAQEIRNALENFKSEGKFIVAYSTVFDHKGYYLASVADKLFLHPEGFILFTGLSGQVTFYKGALEKLGIDMQIIRHGQFKSAVEPFMLDKMSESNKMQTQSLINSVWAEIINPISVSRGISLDDINRYTDHLALNDAKNALDFSFVDGLKYEDEVTEYLSSFTGIEDKKDLKLLTVSKYINTVFYKEGGKSRDRIAVIYASGEILPGKGDDTYIGEKNIVKALRDARSNSRVKAIVLRINSPGGSALVSDLIWREVELTKKEKPVISSMSNVAASGGYYIACNSNSIFAEPTTITGSIGVFGIIPNVQELMNDKLGITFDEVMTNRNSDFMDLAKPLSAFQKAIIQKSVENVYSSFVNKVAKGRNMSFEDVDDIGQGRVWTGKQALDLGLVDKLGGLEDAIKAAAELAELDDYRIQSLPVQKDPIMKMIEDLSGESNLLINQELGVFSKYLKYINTLEKSDLIQARMLFDFEIN